MLSRQSLLQLRKVLTDLRSSFLHYQLQIVSPGCYDMLATYTACLVSSFWTQHAVPAQALCVPQMIT